jgi:hypothetical protein
MVEPAADAMTWIRRNPCSRLLQQIPGFSHDIQMSTDQTSMRAFDKQSRFCSKHSHVGQPLTCWVKMGMPRDNNATGILTKGSIPREKCQPLASTVVLINR